MGSSNNYPYHSTTPTLTSAGRSAGETSTAATFLTPKTELKMDLPSEPDRFQNPNPNFRVTTPLTDSNLTVTQPRSDENNDRAVFNGNWGSSQTDSVINIEDDDDVEDMDHDALALVLVPEEENELSTVDYPSRRKTKRSGELVRVTNLEIEDERYFRELVRKTRMLFDSLYVYVMFEHEKRRSHVEGRAGRARGDLKAAALMKSNDLWLNRDKRIVGAIPGIYVGDVFIFRTELCVLGIHGQMQAGIDYLTSSDSSNGEPIATSVIVSGGYEDDEDRGDVIIYTGHGGQDKNGKQVVHQRLSGGNLAMERSRHYRIEVRVVRGLKHKNGPTDKIYVYDGLYKIDDSWFEIGKSGFGVYKFKLVRIESQPEMGSTILKFAESIKSNPLQARPKGYASLDLSSKQENHPVFLFNDIDDNYDPINYDYLVKTVFPDFVYNTKPEHCNCISNCTPDCICAKKNGGEFAYDVNGILIRGKPVVFECGPLCTCPPTCSNRVTQKGIKNRFEIFRSIETGWGVRSLDLIQAGSFICEYTGLVLTAEQAQMTGEDSLVYPVRFGERWGEWGDLSQVFSDYVRPSDASLPRLEFAMDVSRRRNVACYMSHSACPNVLVQMVMYDHGNLGFPHVMLFAMEDIPPLRELSIDYGADGEWTEKLAICN